jgi:hypothetical protein
MGKKATLVVARAFEQAFAKGTLLEDQQSIASGEGSEGVG